MKKASGAHRIAGISSEAVQARTGKTWGEWFKILDAAGARNLNHQGIVAYLNQKHRVGTWWEQMVTVTYEQACGLRQKHEKPEGFEISVSRTLEVAAARAFAAWEDERLRRQWLKDPGFTIRKATPAKSLRITWVDGKTSVVVAFSPKKEAKSQVAVQHSKLADARQAERMKRYWGEQLEKLKEVVSGQ